MWGTQWVMPSGCHLPVRARPVAVTLLGSGVTALVALLLGPGPAPQQLDHVPRKSPCRKPGYQGCLSQALGEDLPGADQRAGRYSPPSHPVLGAVVKVMLPRGWGLSCKWPPGGSFPSLGCSHHPHALLPSSDPASTPLQDSQAWSEGIWGQEAWNDRSRPHPCLLPVVPFRHSQRP